MIKNKNGKHGFTLVELMVVMALIAVLSTLIVGAIRLATNTSRETTHRSNGRSIQTALEAKYASYRMYCGGSTGVTCNTTGTDSNTQTFTNITAPTALNIDLTSATHCSGTQAGGGTVHVEAGKYLITPYDAACTTAQDTVNVIKVGY